MDAVECLIVYSTFVVTLVGMTAHCWFKPRWLSLTLTAIASAVMGLHVLGQAILLRDWLRLPVAKRPWILGGPPNPLPPQGPDGRG